MSNYILRAEKLSKRYRIVPTSGQSWRRHQRVLVDDIAQSIARFRNKDAYEKRVAFWALQDVSFEAGPGDIVGLIGRNGAGKSTLLKLLGRITEPTSGKAVIYGRVGSLLEVGTGFHSELTGRENIFISGAIIGMSRAEVKRKFDEIVDFSGVEKFLDTPVKRYSSGMEVRLAFSVAAHLHPQVLLVDEVLSVGDVVFQQKSLKKIREVSEYGGTILFVSHNMNTVASLCNRALVLERGKVAFPLGPVAEAIDYYLVESIQNQQGQLEEGRQGGLPQNIKITGFTLRDNSGAALETLTTGQSVNFQIRYQAENLSTLKNANAVILIKTIKGDVIANINSELALGGLNLTSQNGQINCKIDKLPLAPGNITISLIMEQNGQVVDRINEVFIGSIDSGGHLDGRKYGDTAGWLFVESEWSTEQHG
jgi:lipopolysaccharide transport system ATP-binding protein